MYRHVVRDTHVLNWTTTRQCDYGSSRQSMTNDPDTPGTRLAQRYTLPSLHLPQRVSPMVDDTGRSMQFYPCLKKRRATAPCR